MNLHEIEILLEKYFEGATTLSEEAQLREFFASGNVPEKWKNLSVYFTYMKEEKELTMDNPGFDEKIMAKIKEGTLTRITDIRRPWIYWIAGVAASILILVAVFVKFDPFSNRINDTYKDPQVAYTEARKILLFVSSKFNQGTRNLEPVSAMETGLNELKPVTAYGKVVNEVDRLNNVEKVEKMITNN
jgi:hypothetical protein